MKFGHRRPGLVVAAVAAVIGLAFLFSRPRGSTDAAQASPAALTVAVTTPTRVTLPQSVVASGAIAAWQEVVIGAQTGGLQVIAVHVDVGATVRKGELLAELASDAARAELRRLEANLVSARATLAQAKDDAARAAVAREGSAMSDQQYNEYRTNEQLARAAVDSAAAQLDAQRIVLAHTRISAVDDGIITTRSATLGKVVQTGDEMFRMIRQGRLEWQAEVDAGQLAAVQAGQVAQVTLPTGIVVSGRVRVASPSLSTSTARGTVYVSLPAGASGQSGTFASGRIEIDSTPALTVPQGAVVLADGYSYVFEVGDGDRVTRRAVKTGRHEGDRIEIVEGLGEASRIVASGGAFLADGDRVAIASTEAAS